MPSRILKSRVEQATIGAAKFIKYKKISREKIFDYYKNLLSLKDTLKTVLICRHCPLNDAFSTTYYVGCNSFLEDLGYNEAYGLTCREEREVITQILEHILNKARIVKI
jgi:hypothetical protein